MALSSIGYAVATVSNPVFNNSQIGFQIVPLNDPAGPRPPSQIGYATVTLTAPPAPVAVAYLDGAWQEFTGVLL